MSWAPIYGTITDNTQYVVPTTGNTVNIADGVTQLFLNPAGIIATLTVNLPPTPIDGQRVTISSGNVITLLTLGGGTIKGGVAGLVINGYARYNYSAAAGAWFRTG